MFILLSGIKYVYCTEQKMSIAVDFYQDSGLYGNGVN